MNANSISRPINQQTANSWTPLLAAVLLSIALVAGVAGIAALTARSVSTTSPVLVPRSVNIGEQSGQKTLQGVPFPGGVAGPSQLDATKTLPGVPFPGGVAGPSQLDVLKTTPVTPAYDWINGVPHPITAPVFVPAVGQHRRPARKAVRATDRQQPRVPGPQVHARRPVPRRRCRPEPARSVPRTRNGRALTPPATSGRLAALPSPNSSPGSVRGSTLSGDRSWPGRGSRVPSATTMPDPTLPPIS